MSQETRTWQIPFTPVESGTTRRRWSWAARAAFLATGVVLPMACLAIGFWWQPGWQSENVTTFARMLLARKPLVPLYPFLLYSMTSLTVLTLSPERFVKRFAVRFGVYSGVLIALLYLAIYIVALGAFNSTPMADMVLLVAILLGSLVPWLVVWLVLWLIRRFGEVVLWLVSLLFLLSISVTVGNAPFWGLVSLLLTPPWATFCYATMAVYAARNSGVKRMQFSLRQLLAVATWAVAFCAAWRVSYLWMLEEYARLPASNTW